ncbi:MAG: AAA family ATPase, partial [Planctomycetota bacterium]
MSLLWEVGHNLVLAPSTMRLAALEAPGGGLHQLSDKDRRLASLLSRLAHRYDCCLIDCPPTIGLLTFNALRAAREALIPVETGFFAWRGAEKQWSTIQRVIEHIGRPIACHLMATLFKQDSKLARTILASLRRQFAGQILPVVIREHDLLREAASYGQPIIDFAADSDACDDYEQLAEWLCEHATGPPAVEVEVLARHPAPMGGTELEQISAGPQIEGPPDPALTPAPAPGIVAAPQPASPPGLTPAHHPADGGIAVAAPAWEGGGRAAELAE